MDPERRLIRVSLDHKVMRGCRFCHSNLRADSLRRNVFHSNISVPWDTRPRSQRCRRFGQVFVSLVQLLFQSVFPGFAIRPGGACRRFSIEWYDLGRGLRRSGSMAGTDEVVKRGINGKFQDMSSVWIQTIIKLKRIIE